MGCTSCSDSDGEELASDSSSFEQTKGMADSLFNCMQFRDAYDLYLQLLNSKEAAGNSEKRLSVLNSLCNASELSGHKAEEDEWLEQMLDLATQTRNSYYRSMGLIKMGQNVFYEGDHEQGIQYVGEAIDLIEKNDRSDADHLTHSHPYHRTAGTVRNSSPCLGRHRQEQGHQAQEPPAGAADCRCAEVQGKIPEGEIPSCSASRCQRSV